MGDIAAISCCPYCCRFAASSFRLLLLRRCHTTRAPPNSSRKPTTAAAAAATTVQQKTRLLLGKVVACQPTPEGHWVEALVLHPVAKKCQEKCDTTCQHTLLWLFVWCRHSPPITAPTMTPVLGPPPCGAVLLRAASMAACTQASAPRLSRHETVSIDWQALVKFSMMTS